jgi:hypothetical protein
VILDRSRLGLKRAFSDGTIAVEMDGLAFLSRLAASIPGPRFHTVRYAGVLSAAAKWRPLIVPEELDSPGPDTAAAAGAGEGGAPGDEPKARSSWRPWRELLKRSFAIDLLCPKCGAPMKLKAFLVSPQSLRRLLGTLGERTEAPQRAPPRGPPYFQTQAVVRQRQPGAEVQSELFDSPA